MRNDPASYLTDECASSGYEQAESPEILWNEDAFRSEIWIPVLKK
jgi:predicted transcriptional regulator YdeE